MFCFKLRSDSDFFQLSRIRIQGKKCWILIPDFVTLWSHTQHTDRDYGKGRQVEGERYEAEPHPDGRATVNPITIYSVPTTTYVML